MTNSMQPPGKTISNTLKIGILIFCAIIGCLIPSDRSLWQDEAWTALNGKQPNFESWKREFFVMDTPMDILKPLGSFSNFAFSRILGTSEYQMRLQNVLWFFIGLAAIYWMADRFRLWWLPVLYALHPFVWYLVDEVRPYAMQMAGGACLLACTISLIESSLRSTRAALIFVASAFVVSGASLLGLFVVFVYCVYLLVCIAWKRYKLPPVFIAAVIVFTLTQGVLCLFYLKFMRNEVRPGFGFTWFSVAYSLYEFLGFAGLGPDRKELREVGLTHGGRAAVVYAISYLVWAIPLVLVSGVASISSAFAIRRNASTFGKFWLVSSLSLLAGVFLVFVATHYYRDLAFWGRHVSPIFPVFLLLIVAGIKDCGRWTTLLMVVLLIGLTYSSLRFRFDPQYKKEDYRGAAALANKAANEGKSVVWTCSYQAGLFYDVDFMGPNIKTNHQMDTLVALEKDALPELIVINKHDRYPSANVDLYKWLEEHYLLSNDSPYGFRLYELRSKAVP